MREDDRVTATGTDERPVRAADSVLAQAVDLARRAAEEESSAAHVGAHLGCDAVSDDDSPVAVHLFDCTAAAYSGWRWSVSVTRLLDDPRVTVDEVVLQPGDGALLPPPWVPWSERLQAGDLGVGDLLPTAPDDDRLVPAYVATGDPGLDELAYELGLGRAAVARRAYRAGQPDGPAGSRPMRHLRVLPAAGRFPAGDARCLRQ
jgi:hypothetical protein